MDQKATHYVSQSFYVLLLKKCFFDIEIDGKTSGRMDFELFGEKAPKTVNNFLALCSGEFNKYMWYKGSEIHKIHSKRWIMGGDIVNRDGTGSVCIYQNGNAKNFEAEENDLKFSEPYLLVASANEDGMVGSQFFITLEELPCLNGSKHTIFGRLLKGTRTLH
jgi:cyclophilin family peptidyl-prolyl cis-trans isomerase